MFITVISTMNYNEKWTMDTWSKQTQTKPILSRAQSRDLILLRTTLPQGGQARNPRFWPEIGLKALKPQKEFLIKVE
jgi:hypothetical protein